MAREGAKGEGSERTTVMPISRKKERKEEEEEEKKKKKKKKKEKC